jgi:hypothetical protein
MRSVRKGIAYSFKKLSLLSKTLVICLVIVLFLWGIDFSMDLLNLRSTIGNIAGFILFILLIVLAITVFIDIARAYLYPKEEN